MTTDEFLLALDQRIAGYDLLCHPYYQAWSAGQLSRNDLREYATDYYHHVAAFPSYLSALHSRLEDGPARRSVLRNLCEEEIEGCPHSELWLDFAEGMGGNRQDVRQREPIQEIQNLVNEFRRISREGSTAEALAAFYAYESQIPRIAKEKARGLTERYVADNRTAGYFKLHQFADVKHAEVWRELLRQQIELHPEQSDDALNSAAGASKLLWQVLDAMEARRMARVA